MAKAASSEELKDAFEKHLEQTKGHVERLEQVFEELDEKPKGKTCRAMKGLVEEGSEILEQDGDESVRDAGIIVAAQKVEHYEIAGYGSARTFAHLLRQNKAAELFASYPGRRIGNKRASYHTGGKHHKSGSRQGE